jgi:uncharacterized protein (DUF3820 family)
MKLLTFTSIIPFGKYKGKTVRQVISLDSQYLIWLHYSHFKVKLDLTVLKFINPQTNYK